MVKRQRSGSPWGAEDAKSNGSRSNSRSNGHHNNNNGNNNNNNNNNDVYDTSSREGSVHVSATKESLGVFVWNEVGIMPYTCLLKYLHYTCGCLAIERVKHSKQCLIDKLHTRIMTFWNREIDSFSTTKQQELNDIFHPHMNAMMERLSSLASSDMTAGELCRAFLQMLEVFGFPEEENVEEAQLVANVRKAAELHAYSYHKRTSHHLSVLPRYEGDRRTEEQHRLPRAGRVVHFPCPHPHPDVNTSIQLIEPKKRRPPLDENRIFSHPKKATSSGMEDFLVDEELQYRALVVLGRHLDSFGSLQHLSPFLRFVLWNILDRDEELFDTLGVADSLGSDKGTQLKHQQQQEKIETLRRRVAEKRTAFDATRTVARESAVRIGWWAVSAHWRDQVLRVVEDGEDADWYLLRDSAKTGSQAIFPNYAVTSIIKDTVLKALRRVRDGYVDCGVEDTSECYDVITQVLFPLLEGTAPSIPDYFLSDDTSDESDSSQQKEKRKEQRRRRQEEYQELRSRVKSLMELKGESSQQQSVEEIARSTRWNLDCVPLLPQDESTCAFLSDMFVWPLQCLASLLEQMAMARYSGDGLKKFVAAFIQSNWSDEESVLEFLIRREPTNISLASFVGFPRLVRDVYTSAHWLRNDKYFSVVVECRSQGCAMPTGTVASNYLQWRTLSSILGTLDYNDDVLALTVRGATPNAVAEGKLWSVAELQSMPRTPVEGVVLMLAPEKDPLSSYSSNVVDAEASHDDDDDDDDTVAAASEKEKVEVKEK
ncbi:uncharacterized protein TM35_000212690 [Trypanosoma theileri]|uniref:Uncharacterized protein n=1 Tax=Trypanosoma theileri TaxID=67003 RepID=A0A1X0NT69_9TRYP|nr:uncharacterized protein TM35_000212690 [Trypanosoma theileri]ORC87663.1 hypothetical protein TM35_000212690 [Trypanosoma theileri]